MNDPTVSPVPYPPDALATLRSATDAVRSQLDAVPLPSVRRALVAWDESWMAWAQSVTDNLDMLTSLIYVLSEEEVVKQAAEAEAEGAGDAP